MFKRPGSPVHRAQDAEYGGGAERQFPQKEVLPWIYANNSLPEYKATWS